ncbi:glycosyltransferase [Paenibacillus sp. J2TS4]|uniref:glycosyltransferase n=1 Tax=Paenibacillus sp. J2TS4 TaxID=2807194 RepID=UPI001B0129BD|nr:glycosyltransferase [Paenibacillus sp. J2TS4]GIP35026.1 hypothetical protein J2TS4_42360 [Paenibacillus sp. J2TS4]
MILLFAHDFPFVRDDKGNYYSGGGFPYSVWERYLQVFDHVIVAGRLRHDGVKDVSGYVKSSGRGVTFLPMPNLSSPINRLSHMKQAKKILNEHYNKVDAVIGRLPSEIGSLAVTIAEKRRLPWATELVGCPWDALTNHGSLAGKLLAPYSAYRTRKIIKKSSHTIYVTKQFLQQKYPTAGKSEHCSNVELVEINDSCLDGRIKRVANDARLTIGFIGGLNVKYKGLDSLFKALSLIKDRLPDYELRVLGGGNQDSWVQMADSLKLNVKFYGTLPGGEPVMNWLDNIDLYVHPSLTEGLPRALVEAMSRGCACIGSDAGGIPELLDGEYIFPAGNAERMAQLLEKMVTDRDMYENNIRTNLATAGDYLKEKLDERRTRFWRSYAAFCASDSRAVQGIREKVKHT